MKGANLNRLQKIRRFRKWWVVAVFMLVISVVVFYVGPWPVHIREIIVLMGVGLYGIATLLVIFSRCPRCGQLFHNVLGFRNPFSRFCSQCGLSIDDDDLA